MRVTQYKALGLSFGTLVDRERGILEGLRPLAVQAAIATSDAQLLSGYRDVAQALASSTTALSATAFHGQLYQRLAQHLQIIPGWDESVAFSSSSSQWPIFEDAPGALQYLSKFYRLLLIAPPYGIDPQALAKRLPIEFDAIIEPDHDDWHAGLEHQLRRLGLERSELLPVRSTESDDPWIDRVDFPVCTLRRGHNQPWNHSPQAMDGKRCEYASLADLAHAHQKALLT
ncbi:haloacid dehalogenase [Pseudomonas daroniae]|uniref:Haloacid dehalogenase n=2 Tax=Phytopseudomonas TaxID=3236657 RepID=A0A4V2KCQ3_9GAMM|nr:MULTISPECIES: haloacid dehalogenase [Pseudomonas]TBU79724.1 haloacid dehalogenase [Pseudomonas daroniae]TBU82557.1 haloacid dehalogenase [Pseudomonas sp. FRB 228]TBU91730.1 haloacid dehalogenase [Pseudomonas daroniae]TBU95873.1 haloacid dehalogenase [Pseudomonas dryadis]